jgi:hypothetical protein
VVTGNQYYNSNLYISKPIQFRQSYRQIYPFGAIAIGATLIVPHGIRNLTEVVNVYGNCITDVPDFRPIPYASVDTDVTFQIELNVDYTNINIINGASSQTIVSGTIILEYLLN